MVKENVSYSIIFKLNCTAFNVSNISCVSISCSNISSSALYFTQPIGIGGKPTTNMELEVIANTSWTSIFAQSLTCVNASFDTIWTNNLIVDPATEWHVSISNASIVSENVCYSTILIYVVRVLVLLI